MSYPFCDHYRMERSPVSRDETNCHGTVTTSMTKTPPTSLCDPKDWLSLKEAAHLLQVSRRTVRRMTETTNRKTGHAYLRTWRPTPGTLLVSRPSLVELCRMTQEDPDFWQKQARHTRSLSVSAFMKPVRRPRCAHSSRRRANSTEQ
jgi:hypothetical protein